VRVPLVRLMTGRVEPTHRFQYPHVGLLPHPGAGTPATPTKSVEGQAMPAQVHPGATRPDRHPAPAGVSPVVPLGQ
jgi:hypothetical protein